MKKNVIFTLLTLLIMSLGHSQNVIPTYSKTLSSYTADGGSRDTHWQPIDPPGSTGMTATLIGYVEIDGVEQHSPLLEVGIFHNDECRGTDFVSVYIPNQDRYFVYCSFFGLNGEEDHFRIYDHATETELDVLCYQTVIYTDNATFGLPDPYLISFFSNHFEVLATACPEEGGVVTGSGIYELEEVATLSATANDGYTFDSWEKEGETVSSDPTVSFTVTASTAGEYMAIFYPNLYEINATADPTSGGMVEGAGSYYYGTSVTLTATPTTGYHFINWTKDGTIVSTSNIYSFEVEGSANFVANFQLNSYEIAATVVPSVGGSVSGTGNYTYGQMATLTVIPNENYVFQKWTENNEIVSESSSYSFTVLGSRNLVAHLQYVDNLDENNGNSISIYPNPTTDKLTIEAKRTMDCWEIYNAAGTLVYRSHDCCDRKELIMSQFPSGTYMIRLTVDNISFVRRVVKN